MAEGEKGASRPRTSSLLDLVSRQEIMYDAILAPITARVEVKVSHLYRDGPHLDSYRGVGEENIAPSKHNEQSRWAPVDDLSDDEEDAGKGEDTGAMLCSNRRFCK